MRELIRSGKFVAIGNINMNKIAQFYQDRKVNAEQERVNEERKKQQRLGQAQQAILEKQSAIIGVRQTKGGQAGSSLKVCSIRNSSYYGSLIEAYRWTEDFSTWSRARREKGFDIISKSLDEMFVQFKTGQCHSMVITLTEAQTLFGAFQRDQFPYEVFEVKGEAELLASLKERFEFLSVEDASLSLRFDRFVTADVAARFRSFGILNQKDFDKASQRMISSSYSNEVNDATLVSFLEDEATAKAKRSTAVEVRKQREKQVAAKAEADREKYVKSYPYQAVLSCSHGSFSNLPVYMCVLGRGVEAQVLVQNCGRIRKLDYETLALNFVKIELCSSFEIRAQNVSEWTLELQIKDNRSGKTLIHQTAPRFRTVQARN